MQTVVEYRAPVRFGAAFGQIGRGQLTGHRVGEVDHRGHPAQCGGDGGAGEIVDGACAGGRGDVCDVEMGINQPRHHPRAGNVNGAPRRLAAQIADLGDDAASHGDIDAGHACGQYNVSAAQQEIIHGRLLW